jgi:hypothetical protein
MFWLSNGEVLEKTEQIARVRQVITNDGEHFEKIDSYSWHIYEFIMEKSVECHRKESTKGIRVGAIYYKYLHHLQTVVPEEGIPMNFLHEVAPTEAGSNNEGSNDEVIVFTTGADSVMAELNQSSDPRHNLSIDSETNFLADQNNNGSVSNIKNYFTVSFLRLFMTVPWMN